MTGGFDLWLGCMSGKKEAWKKMCDYNKQDVILLERIYLKLRGWMTAHPNMNLVNGTLAACPNCGGTQLTKHGFSYTRVSKSQRFQCTTCKAYCQGQAIKNTSPIIR